MKQHSMFESWGGNMADTTKNRQSTKREFVTLPDGQILKKNDCIRWSPIHEEHPGKRIYQYGIVHSIEVIDTEDPSQNDLKLFVGGLSANTPDRSPFACGWEDIRVTGNPQSHDIKVLDRNQMILEMQDLRTRLERLKCVTETDHEDMTYEYPTSAEVKSLR